MAKNIRSLLTLLSFLLSVDATKLPTCKKANEVFSSCIYKNCQNTCIFPLASTLCGKTGCSSGCTCAPGFLRNKEKACVLPSQCSSSVSLGICSGANEYFSKCGNDGCQRTCARLDVTFCIPVSNIPACICLPGFVRNAANVCVLPSACSTTTCGLNEMFSACGNDGCQRTCTRLDVTGCISVCNTPACVCATGFVRNSFGVCVSPSTCTPTCGANEMFSNCGNDGCQRTCTRLDVTGCISVCNTPACVCATGFVRNSVGVCVLSSTCTPTCGANEMFSNCGNDGCQRTCTRLDVTGCVSVCNTPACVCATGFVRNSVGVCVLPSTCTPTCGANEMFSNCGNDGCQPTCTTQVVTGCIPMCSIPACICATGFVRNVMGACVLPSTCPTVCGANEVFSMCGDDGCQPSCNGVSPDCIPMCNVPACICQSGFLRDNGMCTMVCT